MAMKYTEFSESTKVDHVPPPWEGDMTEQDFISYLPSYEGGKYLDLFEEYIYPCEEMGDMTYYVYNPVKHGADRTKKYPVLVWIHGASNSLSGKFCICNCGGERYASEKYQKDMGGAYVVVPLANEKVLENGEITGGWDEIYLAPVKNIIERVCAENRGRTGSIFAMGGSSGGWFTWELAARYPALLDGIIPVSASVPDDRALETINESGMHILFAFGRHDELISFEEEIVPRQNALDRLERCICYFPEWVRNGDGGIASLYFGFEMGQHCMINQIQANLMYDSGACYDERLPEGVTGWIRKVSQSK